MIKQESSLSTDSLAVLVICNEPYEDCFQTVVTCAERFSPERVWVVDYGQRGAAPHLREWLEDRDLHDVKYVYRPTTKFVALLQTAASLSADDWDHILLVDAVVKSFPASINFDITFSGEEMASCMKLARRTAEDGVSFVWQAINALEFCNKKSNHWSRSLYIWDRSALLACYYYSHVVNPATQTLPPPHAVVSSSNGNAPKVRRFRSTLAWI